MLISYGNRFASLYYVFRTKIDKNVGVGSKSQLNQVTLFHRDFRRLYVFYFLCMLISIIIIDASYNRPQHIIVCRTNRIKSSSQHQDLKGNVLRYNGICNMSLLVHNIWLMTIMISLSRTTVVAGAHRNIYFILFVLYTLFSICTQPTALLATLT